MNEEENKQHANELGYDLICSGKYTAELEREWNSILGIVPYDYLDIWLTLYQYDKKKEDKETKLAQLKRDDNNE
jgi:hypothetical protein